MLHLYYHLFRIFIFIIIIDKVYLAITIEFVVFLCVIRLCVGSLSIIYHHLKQHYRSPLEFYKAIA